MNVVRVFGILAGTAVAAAGGLPLPTVLAQETSVDVTLPSGIGPPRNISPEATKPLPAQLEDGGHLMPLHAASVLSWVCQDPNTQTALGESKAGCYREIYPVVQICTGQLQEQKPRSDNRATEGRLDLLSFRAAFRECLLGRYAEVQQALGRTTAVSSDLPGMEDPQVARMGGISSSD
jgi:hypothetical protein